MHLLSGKQVDPGAQNPLQLRFSMDTRFGRDDPDADSEDADSEAAAGEDDAAGQSLNLVTTGTFVKSFLVHTIPMPFFAQVGPLPITSQHHLLPPAKSHASQLPAK